jgi:PAS domain-containing protein
MDAASERHVTTGLPSAAYVWFPEEGRTQWAPGFTTTFGYPLDDAASRHDWWLERVAPGRQGPGDADTWRHGEPWTGYAIEYRFLAADGTWRDVVDVAAMEVDADGKCVREYGTVIDVTDKRRLESVLEAVAFAASEFLRKEDWLDAIEAVLARLGSAAGANRAYVFENRRESEEGIFMAARAEWTDGTVPTRIGDPGFQSLRVFRRWVERLDRGQPVQSTVDELTEEERRVFVASEVRSFLVVPIVVDGEWWGEITFDDCVRARQWESGSAEALRAAAGIVGAAISRQRGRAILKATEQRVSDLVAGVDAIVWERAGDRFAYLSPQVEQLFGLPAERFMVERRLWQSRIHPEDAGSVREPISVPSPREASSGSSTASTMVAARRSGSRTLRGSFATTPARSGAFAGLPLT